MSFPLDGLSGKVLELFHKHGLSNHDGLTVLLGLGAMVTLLDGKGREEWLTLCEATWDVVGSNFSTEMVRAVAGMPRA